MAMFDRDMCYLAASQRWREDYHLDGVLVGRSHYKVFPEITQDWREFHRRGLAGEIVRAERDVFLRADGARQWLRWEIQPWRRTQGDVGGIVIFTEDITARESELELTRQSEAALRALGDNLPDTSVFRYTRGSDGTAKFLYVSAGVEKITGVKVEAVLADANSLFSQISPEFRPRFLETEFVNRHDLSDFELDVPIRRADGERRWVRLRARPDRRPDGQIIWNGVQTDITEQMRQQNSQREKERRKSYLLEMADALKPLRDPVEITSVVSELLGKHLGAHQVLYAEIDEKEEFATIRREWNDGSMPANIGIHRLADFGPEFIANLRLGKTCAIDDVAADSRTKSDVAAATYGARNIGAFLSVPLVKGGRLVAVLSAHHRERRCWTAFDVLLVEETAERTWAAIERALAEAAMRESEERLRVALGAANAGAWEWDVASNSNVWSDELWRLYGLEPQSRQPNWDTWLSTIHPDDRDAAKRTTVEAAAEGRELSVEWRVNNPGGAERWLLSRGGPIYRTDQATPHYFGVVFDITDRKTSEQKIGYLAHHDALTDLPNRLAFNESLAAAVRNADQTEAAFAVLCLDLDRFKEVNDVFGHVIGDELLRQVSKRFCAALEGFEVARVGGDEFTVIVRGEALPKQAADRAERLRDAVATPFDIDGRQVRVGLSIGAAFYPEHGDIETVLASADAALYRAKAEGGAKLCFFNSTLDSRLRERHALRQDLESAIENAELLLHYQPQADAEGNIFGFEALLRWSNPRRGLVPPDEFIPVAEESGLITAIGEWVLREACQEAASWPKPLSIAVNLSPVQFLKDELPALVHTVLLETGLSGSRLELEITEGVLVNNFSRVSAILRQLKSLGVRVAMDDFGTGYSSLSYLQSFPFDKIKIDRSFVSSLRDNASSQAIVRAIIGLGRGLKVPLIAEGVETQEQLEFLREAGCEEAQGYLIGAPRPIDAYSEFVGQKTEIRLKTASA
jgi:diguanylate cyclase (GGDEF)-like protein/PAS domain S-box-containing protein